MNGLEEIQKTIENFAEESKQTKQQIAQIEKKRAHLAHERNEMKKHNAASWSVEINVLGNQITELGNQSQELQNKLDAKYNEVKKVVNLMLDNQVAENIRKINKLDEEVQELENNISAQAEIKAKYEAQKQEFYERFGRIPELSQNAIKEENEQEKQYEQNISKMVSAKESINDIKEKIASFIDVKQDFKNRNWTKIIKEEVEILPFSVEDVEVEEFEPAEELVVEKIEPLEELVIEPFEEKIVKENKIKEFKTFGIQDEEKDLQRAWDFEAYSEEIPETEDIFNLSEIKQPASVIKEAKVQSQAEYDIEKIAQAIVDEIVAKQAQNINEQSQEEEIITFEETNVNENVEPVFEEKIAIANIIAKVENGEIVYKAQINNGDEIKVYPVKSTSWNMFLDDKEKRKEIKEKIINYAVAQYKAFDKNVIKKVDPTVCEVFEQFAEKYGYDESGLIYNYAMSYSNNVECDEIPAITYNFSYLENLKLSKQEKRVVDRICKEARKNMYIDVIGNLGGFAKIKFLFKKIFASNKENALPEAKY